MSRGAGLDPVNTQGARASQSPPATPAPAAPVLDVSTSRRLPLHRGYRGSEQKEKPKRKSNAKRAGRTLTSRVVMLTDSEDENSGDNAKSSGHVEDDAGDGDHEEDEEEEEEEEFEPTPIRRSRAVRLRRQGAGTGRRRRRRKRSDQQASGSSHGCVLWRVPSVVWYAVWYARTYVACRGQRWLCHIARCGVWFGLALVWMNSSVDSASHQPMSSNGSLRRLRNPKVVVLLLTSLTPVHRAHAPLFAFFFCFCFFSMHACMHVVFIHLHSVAPPSGLSPHRGCCSQDFSLLGASRCDVCRRPPTAPVPQPQPPPTAPAPQPLALALAEERVDRKKQWACEREAIVARSGINLPAPPPPLCLTLCLTLSTACPHLHCHLHRHASTRHQRRRWCPFLGQSTGSPARRRICAFTLPRLRP